MKQGKIKILKVITKTSCKTCYPKSKAQKLQREDPTCKPQAADTEQLQI